MELVKNIFFNTDKIVSGETVKISYVGYLFQNGSEEVYLHYGFGPNWNNVGEAKMEKTELGFQAEIKIVEGEDTLNLCYKNEKGEWDNNFGQNFTFTIEPTGASDVIVDASGDTSEADETTSAAGSDEEVFEGETSLIATSETGMTMHKGLRKSYIWSKKIKLAIYKIIKYVPKIISGNYKRKINEE